MHAAVEVLPDGAYIVTERPGRLRIIRAGDVGKPIELGHGAEVADRPMIVNELADRVRTTLQRMIDSRLARRGNLWTGE